MTEIIHPAIDRLAEFGLGRLSTVESDEIESHLSTCDICRDRVATTPDDRLISLVRMTRPLPETDFIITRSEFNHLRPYAHGGLGTIDLAQDRHFRRDVAVKRIRPELANHAPLRKRFLREAAITARLEHPGIAPVYGIGEDCAGQPCYAMRFVAGETMQDTIRSLHAESNVSLMAMRPLLNRFVSLCNTVAYAHSRKVIHRDIKPANVAIGAFGETILLDWGLAQAEGEQEIASDSPHDQPAGPFDPVHTQTGAVLGTPGYMAPEQKRGETVGPAADVYSLGATLVAIVTGQTPYETAINSTSFIPLLSIAKKAMADLPADRYQDALSLARDVENWLADEPVSAHPDSVMVRLRRWSRRHRLLVTGTTASFAVAVICLVVSMILLTDKNRQLSIALKNSRDNEETANTNAALAKANETEATQHFETALESVGKYTVKVTDDFRLQVNDLEPLRKELLEAAATFYKDLLSKRNDSPILQNRVASAHYKLGYILNDIGDRNGAEREFRAALEIVDKEDDRESRRHLLDEYKACHGLAITLDQRQQYAESLIYIRRAIGAHRSAVGINPVLPAECEEAQSLLYSLGLITMRANRPVAEVESAFASTLAMAEDNMRRFPSLVVFQGSVASVLTARGDVYKDMRRLPEAIDDLKRASSLLKSIPANIADPKLHRTYTLASASYTLGVLYRIKNLLDDASNAFQDGCRASEILIARQPHLARFQAERGFNLVGLAGIHLRKNEPTKAEHLLQEAVQHLKSVYQASPEHDLTRHALMNAHTSLGRAFLLQKQFPKSLEQIRIAETFLRPGESDIDIGRTLTVTWCRYGMAAEVQNQVTEAFESGLRICKAFEKVGEHNATLYLLEQLKDAGFFASKANFDRLKDKEFDPIRNQLAFQKLLADIGKKQANTPSSKP